MTVAVALPVHPRVAVCRAGCGYQVWGDRPQPSNLVLASIVSCMFTHR
jgi:hypothetical protein